MNLTITPNFTLNRLSFAQNNAQNNKYARNSYLNSNLAPMARDTVSFGSKIKKGAKFFDKFLEEAVNGLDSNKVMDGVSHDFEFNIAGALERDAAVPMGYFKSVMNEYFKKMVSTEMGDDKIIQSLDFRIKSRESIFEKMMTLGYKKTDEAVKNGQEMFFLRGKKDAEVLLGDIIAGRIVLRDDSKESVKKVFKVLEKIVKDGKWKFTKIESFRPVIGTIPDWVVKGYKKDLGIKLDDKRLKMMTKPDYFAYASTNDMASLATTCRSTYPDLEVDFGKDLPNGYQAIHMNFLLPDGSVGELQIMGRDVEKFKDLIEDHRYKKICLKKVKYGPLDERLAPLATRGEEVLQRAHVDYTRWTYIGQRLKEPRKYSQKINDRYLTAPQMILDRGLGYNQLAPLGYEAKQWEKAQKEANKNRRH